MKAVLILLTLLLSVNAVGQTCSEILSAKVINERGQPLVGASVLNTVNQTVVLSDENGFFKFEKLCAKRYALILQYEGYKTRHLDVTLPADIKSITLEPAVTNLEEIIVHDKIEQTEHAHNFTQLSNEALDAAAGKTLGETLRGITGVNTIQSGPGIFKPVIHGVHSQRILILNHGVRQEGQQWGAEHAPEIDPFIASNIVVIKDASSIKYGTDALGGVIVVNPAPLPERAGMGGTMHSVFQSNGRSGAISGMLEGGINRHDGWGWRVQGTAKQSGDFHTPDYMLTNTGLKELNFSAATGYHGKHGGVELFFSHFQTELGILRGTSIGNVDDLTIAMERAVPEYTSSFSYKIREPRQDVSHNLFKVNGHLEREKGTVRFQYGFQNNTRSEFDIRIGSLSSTPINDLKLNTHTAEAEWETGKKDKRMICFGVTGLFQQNQNIYGTNRIPFIPDFTSASGGVFGITKWYLKNWVVDVGMRYDYRKYLVKGYDYKNAFYSADLRFQNVSVTAGGTLTLPKNSFLSVNVSSAWRPPHVAELYCHGKHVNTASIEYGLLLNDSTTEVMNIRDVSFNNEKAVKLVSSYQRQGENIEIELTGFVNYIFNYIYLKPIGVTKKVSGIGPAFQYTQTDALFLGLDLSAQVKINSTIKIKPKASLLRASDEKNNDYLVFIPTNRYELSIRYERASVMSLNNLFFELKPNYVARQRREPREISPQKFAEASEQQTDPLEGSSKNFDFKAAPEGYFLLNSTTGFSVKRARSRYDFRFGVENVFNTRYREYTNRLRYYANDLGRNFIITLKYTF